METRIASASNFADAVMNDAPANISCEILVKSSVNTYGIAPKVSVSVSSNTNMSSAFIQKCLDAAELTDGVASIRPTGDIYVQYV
jgi:hypothetical protein